MHVLTYGSLMFPEAMEALLGRSFAHEKISFEGFERFAVANEVYPAAIRSEGNSLEGRLYFDLDALALAVLDRFEGDVYERISVPVRSPSRGDIVADLYVLASWAQDRLLQVPWSPEVFESKHLSMYVEGCRRFLQSFLPQHLKN
jgi:hypothetical protein